MARAHVPEAVAPPPGHPRFPLFDSLRAVAALSIVFVHAALFSGVFPGASYRGIVAHLDIGVAIFFVISGFLLYRPFLAARILGAPGTPIHVYARRRFLRIAPAYWLALTALAIFPGVYGAFSHNWWAYYGLLQNYPIYTRAGGCADLYGSFNCGIAPAWSLAVEVFFYAVLPFFALLMASLTGRLARRRWLWVELAVLAGLSACSVWIQDLRIHGSAGTYFFFSPLGRAWWFALGMALAAVSVWVQERGRKPAALRILERHPAVPWAAAATLYLLGALWLFDPVPTLAGPAVPLHEYVGEYLLFGLVAGLVVVPAVFGDRPGGLPRRLLQHRIPAWLGLISYGIFLWHFPILFALQKSRVAHWWPAQPYPVLLAATLAITIPCAALSYYLVERPLMRLKYRRGGHAPPRGALGVPERARAS